MEVPRIAPLEPPHPPAIAEALARWMPPAAPVPPLALFRTLLRHPALAEAMHPLGSFLLGRRPALPRRDREIAILRICGRCGCAYEWGVHAAAFAGTVGLDEETVRATWSGGAQAFAAMPREATLVRVVDALDGDARVPDALFAEARAHFSDEALLELFVLCGWYRGISYVANAAAVVPETWARAPGAGPSGATPPVR